MEGKIRTSFSKVLDRDMTYKTFGKRGGRLCIALVDIMTLKALVWSIP